ncbi:endonuclease NucS [Bombiscardovia nodaiensis]|uniref:Endonuclease NucS n=1 Tax=Bombiscardovia nodaiensis TaxID=2932181 RepID=A0ABN6SC25_9BIFI|nr:endonuclease NucS [Bombiscardovia nodaiensis]
MRIIVADCSAQYSGRLNASLPRARRVLLIKADSSCLIFSEIGSYKPLNWMCAPCTIKEIEPGEQAAVIAEAETSESEQRAAQTELVKNDPVAGADKEASAVADLPVSEEDAPGVCKILRVSASKSSDILTITLYQVYSDQTFELGQDPGLVKDGVEDHLQHFLAQQIERIGEGAKLVRREYPTPIGPVDIMAIDGQGQHVAIEIKRHGGIDGVEQLTRYVKLLNRDPLLAPVRGMFAAQTITQQARVLAEDRGFECLILDYDEMKGTDSGEIRLF